MTFVDTVKNTLSRALREWHQNSGRTIAESSVILNTPTKSCINLLTGGKHMIPLDNLLRMSQQAKLKLSISVDQPTEKAR